MKGSWTEYELRALWREEDGVLQFLTFPDVKVAEHARSAIYETIGLVNEQLWLGHFELWSSSGILLYRQATLVDRDEEATRPYAIGPLDLQAVEARQTDLHSRRRPELYGPVAHTQSHNANPAKD